MDKTTLRQASVDARHASAASRAQTTGGGWATYALTESDGAQVSVVRVPLDRGVIDVLQCGARYFVWNETRGSYVRARVHYVTLDECVRQT
jgi:hypothetical protein